MPLSSEKVSSRPKSGRVAATAIIWGCSIGMLAISLPLSGNAQSGMIISIAIIAATAMSTITVWLSTGSSAAEKGTQPEIELSNQVRELHERIVTLEAIAHFQSLGLPQAELEQGKPANGYEP
jgi:hypothetical protein